MTDYINVKVVSLRELFSGAYRFRLPWFQRAYAWQNSQVGRLLTDVFDVMEQTYPLRQRYFLGSLMVARPPGQLDTALVDGHQRVMTLTLLFAVIRDLEPDPVIRSEIQNLIGTTATRLQPQDNLEAFCTAYVQSIGATVKTPDTDSGTLSEAEQNIIENRDYLRDELSNDDVSEAVRRRLLTTLADRCFVIVQEVADEDEAWRILQIEEETRHGFNPANRAKVSLLSMVPQAERESCRLIWEDCEAKLGSEDLHRLLGYLRTLKLRRRSERPFETDVAQAYDINMRGIAFMRDDVGVTAESLALLRRKDIGAASQRAEISASIDQLTWISKDLWVPAALHWLKRRGDKDEFATFMKRLDRMVWMMRVAGIDPIRQQRKIISLLNEIDKDQPVASMRELDISSSNRTAVLANLRSNNFDAKHYAGRVLRRVSAIIEDGGREIDETYLTIEHILPKGFVEGSPWRHNFRTERSVKDYAHRLGNLTLLNALDNNLADSRHWSLKCPLYLKSEFKMTRDLASLPDWTPEAINQRTEDLIALLFKSWDLEADPAISRSSFPRFN